MVGRSKRHPANAMFDLKKINTKISLASYAKASYMYYINFSLIYQSVDRVTSSQIIQNNIVDTICLYLVMESKINNMLHIIFTLHPVDYLSPHPNHGFKRQHSILLITITSPESRLQKTTLHPVDYLSPHPNHGFKRQHSIPLITYHLTRITASKDNTPSRQLPITLPESRLQKTTLHPVNYLSPHPNHGFKRQHSIPSITYHLTRITASKDNTPITHPRLVFSHNYKYQT